MTVLQNTLEPVMNWWDDPGERGMCGGGTNVQRSYQFVEDVRGQLVLSLTSSELATLKHTTDDLFELAGRCLDETCGTDVEVEWSVAVDGRMVTLKAADVRQRSNA